MPLVHVTQIEPSSLTSFVDNRITGITNIISGNLISVRDLSESNSGKIDILSGDFDSLVTSFSDYSGRQDAIESDISDINFDISQLKTSTGVIDDKIESVSGSVFSSLDSFESSLDTISDDVSSLDTKIENIEETVSNSISSFSSSIYNTLETVNAISGNVLLKSGNLSDLESTSSGQRNLNLQRQYLFLGVENFSPLSGHVTGHPLDYYAGTTGFRLGDNLTGVFSRIQRPALVFLKNGNIGSRSFASFILPNNWDRRRIYPKVYCLTTGGLTSATVSWGLAASFFDDDQRLSGSSLVQNYHNISSVFSDGSSISGKLSINPRPASGMWISGSSSGNQIFDQLCILKVFRNDNADDTLPSGQFAFLLGVGIEYYITGAVSPPWGE